MKAIDLFTWCMDRQKLARVVDEYIERGNKTRHIVKFENGETIEILETYRDSNNKSVETKINDETVHKADYIYYSFGWHVAEVA